MVEKKAEVRVVFAVAPPPTPEGVLSMIVGISKDAWHQMEHCNHLVDLTEMGLPLKLLMFRGETYERCAQTIEMFKAKIYRTYNDDDDDDGSVKFDA
jgi:hypothetical protein